MTGRCNMSAEDVFVLAQSYLDGKVFDLEPLDQAVESVLHEYDATVRRLRVERDATSAEVRAACTASANKVKDFVTQQILLFSEQARRLKKALAPLHDAVVKEAQKLGLA